MPVCHDRIVARQPAKTLLQALLGTAIGEDALTDGLAYLLNTDAGVADAFASMLELPPGPWRCESSQTQYPVGGRRVDLEVVLTSGATRRLLWVEAKAFTRDHDDQLRTYLDALADRESELGTKGEVVTLAPLGNPIENKARELKLKHLTWQQVLTSIVVLAEKRAGPQWRKAASQRDAQVGLRDLFDYRWALEHEDVAVDVTALEPSDEHVARRAEVLLNPNGVIGVLLDAAAQVEGYEPEAPYSWPRGDLALTIGRSLAPRTKTSWIFDAGPPVEVTIQLWFSTSDARACPPSQGEVAAPAFLIGVVFNASQDHADAVRQALSDSAWLAELPAGIVVGLPEDEEVWIVGTKALSELSDQRVLHDQISALREWASTTLSAIFATQRPPQWPAAAR